MKEDKRDKEWKREREGMQGSRESDGCIASARKLNGKKEMKK